MPIEIFELPEDTASFLRTEAKAQKANGNGIWKLLEEAAECIDRLSRNLNGRDDFIVNLGLWDDFVRQLPKIAAKRSPQTPRPASPPCRRARHIAVPR